MRLVLRALALGSAVTLSLLLIAGGCAPRIEEAQRATPVGGQLSDEQLKAKLDEAIAYTQARHMQAEVHNAWQIVHGIVAYGRDLNITAGGKVVPALDYLLQGGELRGWTFRPGDRGLIAVMEPGTKQGQGHHDQWLGYMSQVGLPPEQTIIVKGQEFKLADLISQAQWDLYPGMEASWTLMALSSYLPLDASFTSKDGNTWTVEKIGEMEAGQDIATSACGGTHRLYGLAMALNQHLRDGGKITGGWVAVDNTINKAAQAAKDYQQPDGNFSTSFFSRPGTSPDIATVMHATGHTFEFLCMALPDEELRQPWMRKAAIALLQLFDETRDMEVECGALYHGAHGLILYRERMFGAPQVADEPEAPAQPAEPAKEVATAGSN